MLVALIDWDWAESESYASHARGFAHRVREVLSTPQTHE